MYHLPSEAEWEYGARAGSTTTFPWGTELDYDHGNFGKYEDGLGGHAEGRDVWISVQKQAGGHRSVRAGQESDLPGAPT
jgi:formylglycine-generating enzyme required for sulfatase activity